MWGKYNSVDKLTQGIFFLEIEFNLGSYILPTFIYQEDSIYRIHWFGWFKYQCDNSKEMREFKCEYRSWSYGHQMVIRDLSLYSMK